MNRRYIPFRFGDLQSTLNIWKYYSNSSVSSAIPFSSRVFSISNGFPSLFQVYEAACWLITRYRSKISFIVSSDGTFNNTSGLPQLYLHDQSTCLWFSLDVYDGSIFQYNRLLHSSTMASQKISHQMRYSDPKEVCADRHPQGNRRIQALYLCLHI